MKQIIPFVKDISLDSKISEITSIALEHNLKMENNDSVVGTFTISGKYRVSEISINEEVFEKKIEFDITLDDKYDASKVTIDVDDFYYEIINEEYLRVHIDVLVDNLVYYKEQEPVLEEQEKEIVEIITEDEKASLKKEEDERGERKDIMINEEKTLDEEKMVDNEEKETNQRDDDTLNISEITDNITSGFLSTEEKYSTYKVHIIRENESVETVMEKYNVSKEELEKYNSLDNVMMGTKIIVPLSNE